MTFCEVALHFRRLFPPVQCMVHAQYVYTNIHKRNKLANLLQYVWRKFGCQYPKGFWKSLHCREAIRSETQAFSTLNVLANPFVRAPYTDKKEIKFSPYIRIFRMEQLQSHIWLTASSYIWGNMYLRIPSYSRKPFLICDFAAAALWISLYLRKIRFSFLSVYLWPEGHEFGSPEGQHLVRSLKVEDFSLGSGLLYILYNPKLMNKRN